MGSGGKQKDAPGSGSEKEKRKSRITFLRATPPPLDFDDVEETITGSVSRRKKDFATSSSSSSAAASTPSSSQTNHRGMVGSKRGSNKAAAKNTALPYTQLKEPNAVFSPLQGVDLKEGKEERKTFHFHKHYGWLYGEHTENPIQWMQRNVGKFNAGVVSFVKTCDTMIKGRAKGRNTSS